jgi:hypothetical protein
MGVMDVFFQRKTEEAQLAMTCACGPCHPTATAYRDDPRYEWHDPRLAEGPCCCGRFFAIGHDEPTATRRAEAMAYARQREGSAPKGYDFRTQQVPIPWGSTVVAVSATPRE